MLKIPELVSVATECVLVPIGSSVVPQRGREKGRQEDNGKEVDKCWKKESGHTCLLAQVVWGRCWGDT